MKESKNRYKDYCPLQIILKDAPPNIISPGTDDKLLPVDNAKYHIIVM